MYARAPTSTRHARAHGNVHATGSDSDVGLFGWTGTDWLLARWSEQGWTVVSGPAQGDGKACTGAVARRKSWHGPRCVRTLLPAHLDDMVC